MSAENNLIIKLILQRSLIIFLKNEQFIRSFIKRQTSGTSSDNEWQRVVQQVTMNDNEWQQMATSGTTSDNERQRVTTSDNQW